MNPTLLGFRMPYDQKPELEAQTPGGGAPGADRGGSPTGSDQGSVSHEFAAALADGVAAGRRSHAAAPRSATTRAGDPEHRDGQVGAEGGDPAAAAHATSGPATEAASHPGVRGDARAPLRDQSRVGVEDVEGGAARPARGDRSHFMLSPPPAAPTSATPSRSAHPPSGSAPDARPPTRDATSVAGSRPEPVAHTGHAGHASAEASPWLAKAPSPEAPLGQLATGSSPSIPATVVVHSAAMPAASRAAFGESQAASGAPRPLPARASSFPHGAKLDPTVGPMSVGSTHATTPSRPPRDVHAGAEPGASAMRSFDVFAPPLPSTAVGTPFQSHAAPPRSASGFAPQQLASQASRPRSAYPLSPIIAAMPESVVVPSPLRAFEPRRVRAAVLELQHRISGVETVASAPSHVVFGTHARADKTGLRNHPTHSASPAPRDGRVPSTDDPNAGMSDAQPGSTHAQGSPSTTSRSRSGAPRAGRSDRSPTGEAGDLQNGVQAQLFASTFRTAPKAAQHAAASPGTTRATISSATSTGGSAAGQPAIQGRGAETGTALDPSLDRHRRREAWATSSEAAGSVTLSSSARPSSVESPSSGGGLGAGVQPAIAPDGAFLASGLPSGLASGFLPGASLGASALVDLALEDPSLHAAALGKNSHIRLDTGGGEQLALHLRVEDGIVDLRVEGSAAQTIDIRQNELRTALASEGISLGHFESHPHSQAEAPAGGPKDAADTGFRAPPDGGQTPSSHSGSSFGGGNRQFEAGDRWSDRETSSPPRPGSTGASHAPEATDSDDDRRRRRGFHVTA